MRRAGRQHCGGQRHLCASQLRTSSKPIWLAMLSKWCWRSSLSESCAGAAWKAELTITKPVGEASTTFYFRSMDKYQEPFTMPANIAGQLETQRGTVDLTETVIRLTDGALPGRWRAAELDSQGRPVWDSQGLADRPGSTAMLSARFIGRGSLFGH
ncbi:hypothetical protein ALQ50_200034 [Pseudomonas coronafaciens pv. coronafaciens]|nr:hypothetical protein ALQ50_200034 [Pseudomonas coronafaciens pv. coronafaciens]